MLEEEKNRMYLQVRENLLNLCKNELSKLDTFINVSSGLVVGAVFSSLVFGLSNPNFNFAFPLAYGSVSLIANIASRISKKQIIDKADKTAKKIIDEAADLSNMMGEALSITSKEDVDLRTGNVQNGPFMSWGFMPLSVDIFAGINPTIPEEFVIEADYEVLDDNGPSFKEKCELLIQYAQDVGYPGFEEDVETLTIIISVLDNDKHISYYSGEYIEIIKELEQSMLDKAYKFYTGDYAR